MPLPADRKRRHDAIDNISGAERVSTTQSHDSGNNNVKVVVRVRPENCQEIEGNHNVIVRTMNENVLVFDPKEQSSPDHNFRKFRRRDVRKRVNKDLKFAFDYVFGPESVNKEVYEQTTKVILDGLLNGYNCSVFAYGATGAGKTHTMLGNKSNPGVMYLTMVDLYNRIADLQNEKTCDVAVSYLEVYNEQIHDLLMPGGSLPIREDPSKGVVIPGLSLHKPKNAEELLYMLQFGNQNRTQHPTDANSESSRSHAVFQVFVRQRDRTANISTELRIAKMCLVDLAGSERATVTKNRGSRFREGANINRSLLALGNVINALADNKSKGHIPYRDSKLTRLLKDSLGGNCQTVMIAAVSPSSQTYEDTYNTLKYADRAKHIKATLKKNVLNVDFHVARYGQIVQELRKEVVELKEKLQQYEEGKIGPVKEVKTEAVSRFQTMISSMYATRMKIRHEQLRHEISFRDLHFKIQRKEKCLARLTALDDTQAEKSVEKMRRIIYTSEQKLLDVSDKRQASQTQLVINCQKVRQMEQDMTSSFKSASNVPEVLNQSLSLHNARAELHDVLQLVGYLRKFVRSHERELHMSDRLIVKLLQLVQQQQDIIRSRGLVTTDLDEKYSEVKLGVEGREISWADQVETDDSSNSSKPSFSEMIEFPPLWPVYQTQTGDPVVNPHASTSSLTFSQFSCTTTSSDSWQARVPPSTNTYRENCTDDPSHGDGPKRVVSQQKKIVGLPSRVDTMGIHHHPSAPPLHSLIYTPVRDSEIPSSSQISRDPESALAVMETDISLAEKVTCYAGHTPAAKKALLLANSTSVDSAAMVTGSTSQSEISNHVTKGPDLSSRVSDEKDNSHAQFTNNCDTNSASCGRKQFQNLNSTFEIPQEFVKKPVICDKKTKLNETFCLDETFTLNSDASSAAVISLPVISDTKVLPGNSAQQGEACTYSGESCVNSVESRKGIVQSEACASRESCNSYSTVAGESVNARGLCNSANLSQDSHTTQSRTHCVDSKTVVLEPVHTFSLLNVSRLQTQSEAGSDVTHPVVSGLPGESQVNLRQDTFTANPSSNLAQCSDVGPVQAGRFSASKSKVLNLAGSQTITKSVSLCGSQTVTKSEPVLPVNFSAAMASAASTDNSASVIKTVAVEDSSAKCREGREKTHAVRSITFDGEVCCTPEKGKSYAAAVKTPTPLRLPLRDVNGSNTPLATLLTPSSDGSRGSSGCSDTSSSELKPAKLLQKFETNVKENTAQRVPRGGKVVAKPCSSSETPGYMQLTKSATHRKQLPKFKSTLDVISTAGKGTGLVHRNYRNTLQRPRNLAPILSRSKSLSSLHKSGWQI